MTAHMHPRPQGFYEQPVSYIEQFGNFRVAFPEKSHRVEVTMTDGKVYYLQLVSEEWADALRIVTEDNLPHLIRKHLIRSVTVVTR